MADLPRKGKIFVPASGTAVRRATSIFDWTLLIILCAVLVLSLVALGALIVGPSPK